MSYKPVFLFFFAISAGCQEKKIDQNAEGEKLMQISREWSRSASTNDIEKTISYWADTAILLSAGQPMLRGKNAIRTMVEESLKIPGFKISWEPVSASVSESGDMAYLIEKNQMTMTDSSGRTVTKVWERSDHLEKRQ